MITQSFGIRDEYRVAKTWLRRNGDSKYKQYYIIFVLLFLIYFTLYELYPMLCGDLNGMEILKKGCIVISLHTHLQAVNFQRCKHVYASCCTVLVYFSGHCGSRSVVSDSLQAMDHTVHGILQTRILEWVAVPSSRESSQPRDQTQVSHIADWLLPSEPPGKLGI